MKSDKRIKDDVERELAWEPSLDERPIAVAVTDGIVTLTGDVGTFSEKYTAEQAAERVGGVTAVVNDLGVDAALARADADIAAAAANALLWNASVPADLVTVGVVNGWVTLSGTVEWDYQRRAAADCLRSLWGVRGITNNIVLAPRVAAEDLRQGITDAFARQAWFDGGRVSVEAADGDVTLRGSVRTLAERDAAEDVAWDAPGVTDVHDYITVENA